MLDIQILRADTAAVAARLSDRGYVLDVAQFTALENERKAIQTETQDLQARRNALSKQIGQLKAKKEDASALMAEVNAQAEQLTSLEQGLEAVQQKLSDFLMHVPNVPHASVPAGRDADANVDPDTLAIFDGPLAIDATWRPQGLPGGNIFHAPAWFKAGLPALPLDGELFVGRGKFNDAVSIVRSMTADWSPVRNLVFDVQADGDRKSVV